MGNKTKHIQLTMGSPNIGTHTSCPLVIKDLLEVVVILTEHRVVSLLQTEVLIVSHFGQKCLLSALKCKCNVLREYFHS